MTGLPVVASGVGGVASAVEDGVSGRLVPPGDVGALARAVAEVLDAPRTRAAMSAAARRRAVARFDAAAMAEKMEQLLESAASRS